MSAFPDIFPILSDNIWTLSVVKSQHKGRKGKRCLTRQKKQIIKNGGVTTRKILGPDFLRKNGCIIFTIGNERNTAFADCLVVAASIFTTNAALGLKVPYQSTLITYTLKCYLTLPEKTGVHVCKI